MQWSAGQHTAYCIVLCYPGTDIWSYEYFWEPVEAKTEWRNDGGLGAGELGTCIGYQKKTFFKAQYASQETKHLSTDADSSTNTTVGWIKNTQKHNFFEKRKKSSKTQNI